MHAYYVPSFPNVLLVFISAGNFFPIYKKLAIICWFNKFFMKFELRMKIWSFCDKILWKTRQINEG